MDSCKVEIFISHSSEDKEIVKQFMEQILIKGLEFSHRNIFCTSIDGTKINSGENWREAIRGNIRTSKVIFLIITPNYKDSDICMNEMGAAWMTNNKIIPLIIEPINFGDAGVIIDINQIEKLNEESSLDRIKDELNKIFIDRHISSIKSDWWTEKKKEFLQNIKFYLQLCPFDNNKLNKELEKIKAENLDLKNKLNDCESVIEGYKKKAEFINYREASKNGLNILSRKTIMKILDFLLSYTHSEITNILITNALLKIAPEPSNSKDNRINLLKIYFDDNSKAYQNGELEDFNDFLVEILEREIKMDRFTEYEGFTRSEGLYEMISKDGIDVDIERKKIVIK